MSGDVSFAVILYVYTVYLYIHTVFQIAIFQKSVIIDNIICILLQEED